MRTPAALFLLALAPALAAAAPEPEVWSPAARDGGAAPASAAEFRVDFGEPVSGFNASGLAVGGTAAGGSPAPSAFSGSGASYSFEVDGGPSGGTVVVEVPAGAALGEGGGPSRAAGPYSVLLDPEPPRAVGARAAGSSVLVLFSEPVRLGAGGHGFSVSGARVLSAEARASAEALPLPSAYVEAGRRAPPALSFPVGADAAPDGTIYVADTGNDRIVELPPGGGARVLAGSSRGHADGPALSAMFDRPEGVAAGPDGTVYVGDSYNRMVRAVSPEGEVTTLAGAPWEYIVDPDTGVKSVPAGVPSDGPGSEATFVWVAGVAAGPGGEVYVADSYGDRVRIVSPGGEVSTLSWPSGGHVRFDHPTEVAAAPDGTIYVADSGRNTVFAVPPGGGPEPAAGPAGVRSLKGVAVGPGGEVYATDFPRLLRAGDGGAALPVAGSERGLADGRGAAAALTYPKGLAVSPGGDVYVVDHGAQAVRAVSPGGEVRTFSAYSGEVELALDAPPGPGAAVSYSAGGAAVRDAAGNAAAGFGPLPVEPEAPPAPPGGGWLEGALRALFGWPP